MDATIAVIGGKYKLEIIYYLFDRTLRYSELAKLVKATPKMLAEQLKELERDGIINRVLYPVVPPKVEYSLSDFGKSIIPVLDFMCRWGNEYLEKIKRESLHLGHLKGEEKDLALKEHFGYKGTSKGIYF